MVRLALGLLLQALHFLLDLSGTHLGGFGRSDLREVAFVPQLLTL